jgi:putative chitinase
VPVRVNRNGAFEVRASHQYDALSDYRVAVSVSTVDRSGNATRDDRPFIGRASTDQSKAVITCPVTVATLRAIASASPQDNALMEKYAEELNAAMDRYGIATQAQQAAFLAQSAQESVGFNDMREGHGFRTEQGRINALTSLYGPRSPNYRPDILVPRHHADGSVYYDPNDVHFYGRGFLQLTGRANYKQASLAIFGDERLLTDPDLVARDPRIAALASAWYWTHHGGPSHTPNALADDTPSIDEFKQITRAVNGGLNGWTQRKHYYQRALETIYFGIAQSEQLASVSSRGQFQNVVDDNNLNPAHVDVALQSVLDAINAFGRGAQVDVWVSRYLGKDKWSDPFDDVELPREHRRLNAGYACSAVDLSPPRAAYDVDGDQQLNVRDVLTMVDLLRANGAPFAIPTGSEEWGLLEPDMDGDNLGTIQDLLVLVQELRTRSV